MADNVYEISFYRVRFGSSVGGLIGNVHVKPVGAIHVGGTDENGKTAELKILFVPDGHKMPDPPATSDGSIICMPSYMMPVYIDVLRNEKPCWLQLYPNNPEYAGIRTSWEPSGAEDDNT